jgi:hypothetical protein
MHNFFWLSYSLIFTGQAHQFLDERKGTYLSYMYWLKQAQAQISSITRHMSPIYLAVCLNMLPPGLILWVPGCDPKGVHPSTLNTLHKHTNGPRHSPTIHTHFQQRTSISEPYAS